jgi:hypothetical protein
MIAWSATAFAQGDPQVEPRQFRILNDHAARAALGGAAGSGSSSTQNLTTPGLPGWTYTTTAAQDGKTYTGTIVGTSPTAGTGAASVTTPLVPVIIRITQGGQTYTFDPTAGDTGCLGSGNTAFALTQASPLFTPTSFIINGTNIGPTQFGDAFLQAQFWNQINSSRSPLLTLSTTIGSPLTISINAGPRGNSTATVYSLSGTQCGTSTATTNPGGKIGVVNINTIDSALKNYITSNSLTNSQFPFFVTYNAVMSVGGANNINNCCVLGYHNALSSGQTYGIAEFEGRNQTVFSGVADVAAASHEINEWINDPGTGNPTPAWGNIGQVSGCQSNFEVGDPLSGKLMPTMTGANGFNYHLQESAFFSWFYGASPSLGAGSVYSSNGTFKGFAKLCPSGGTN